MRMMTHVGRFAWHDMMTTDFAASEAFYRGLFDWTLDESDQASGYCRLRSGGQAFGGMMTWPPDGPSQSMWTGYVVTEDLANTARRARELGGFVPVESMAIPDVGRLGVVIDPTGAPVTVFQPLPGVDMGAVGPGGSGNTVQWNELATTDLAASVDFHTRLFGWTVDQSVVEAEGYVVARLDGAPVAGFFQPQTPPASSGWLTYFEVADTDATIERAKGLGAEVVHGATDVPNVGRTAWLLDPTGAIFGLIQPLEGWFERL
jgi:predicted enzyme related to lactoylglutathione lyase